MERGLLQRWLRQSYRQLSEDIMFQSLQLLWVHFIDNLLHAAVAIVIPIALAYLCLIGVATYYGDNCGCLVESRMENGVEMVYTSPCYLHMWSRSRR